MKKEIILSFFLLFIASTLHAQIIRVPQDQPTIQAGIDSAVNGDTVLVDTGIYYENIRFLGKAITLASKFILGGDTNHINNTVINGSQPTDPDSAAVVMFLHGEDTTSILKGFTIIGGTGVYNTETYFVRAGGGIFAFNSGPAILNNRIIDNHVVDDTAGAAGIGCMSWINDVWTVIDGNTIKNNTSTAYVFSAFGGGIASSANTIIRNNIIENNSCTNDSLYSDGGGIEIEKPPAAGIYFYIHNNVIRNNNLDAHVQSYGGGISILNASGIIRDNMISGNVCSSDTSTYGGGILIYQQAGDSTNVTLTGNTIGNNLLNSPVAIGGGAYVEGTTTVISGNTFQGNVANTSLRPVGAGLALAGITGPCRILNNLFEGNEGDVNATNGGGGGIAILDAFDITVTVDGNKFMNNDNRFGGAFYERNTYNIKITNNVFDQNMSKWGGALGIYHPNVDGLMNGKDSFVPQFVNNTFYANHSTAAGGAIFYQGSVNQPVIFNSVFVNNVAPNGKDIYNLYNYDLTVSYSCLDTTAIHGAWKGEMNIDTNPMFVNAANGDFHILHNSPCAGAGSISLDVGPMTYFCPDFDFEGDPRPLPMTHYPDMGADEVDETAGGVPGCANHFKHTLSVYPNPFKDNAIVEINLRSSQFARVVLTDFTGRIIEILYSGNLQPGVFRFSYGASELPGGLLLIRLEAGNETMAVKVFRYRY